MAMAEVTVFGGSGFVGRHLVPRLMASGAKVRIAARHVDRLRPLSQSHQQLETVKADVLDDASVASAVAGASCVLNLVGILTEADGQTYDAIHVEGARRVALAAKKAGALRLIHVSALGASREAPARSDRTKAEGERVVRAAFPGATLVRPSLVFGRDDHFFNRLAAMARRSPVLPLIGGGRTKFEPLYVGDMAAALSTILQRPATVGRTYELGGPEVHSFRELLELLLAAIGLRRVLVSIPFPLAEIQAAILELLPAPPLTRDQVRLLKTDKVTSGREPTLADLGIRPTLLATILPLFKETPTRHQ